MAVYLVGRGIEYYREGIDDIGDIYEICDGPEPPSGPGYALSDIITIKILSREEVESILNVKKPFIDFDLKTGIEYWQNPEDDKWYEVKIKPKYTLNFANLNLQDRAILASDKSTSLEQITALGKIRANITQYEENTQTLKPEK